MKLELVSIATDTYPLDGLLYTPDSGTTKAVAMFLHGNCHNFYMGPSRFMPETLVAHGIACLAYNRRGHDMITSLTGRAIGGGSFQLAHEAIADNEYAAHWLAARGFPPPILIGHSNGGVLAAQHCAEHPETPACVLLSAHCGGYGVTEKLGKYGLFGCDRLGRLIAEAEAMVADGRGKELVLLPGWWWAASAECILDYSRNMPATLDNAKRMKSPILFIRGEEEPEDMYPALAFAQLCAGPCEVNIMPGCDHFYTGFEREVSRYVTDWLVKTCKLAPAEA